MALDQATIDRINKQLAAKAGTTIGGASKRVNVSAPTSQRAVAQDVPRTTTVTPRPGGVVQPTQRDVSVALPGLMGGARAGAGEVQRLGFESAGGIFGATQSMLDEQARQARETFGLQSAREQQLFGRGLEALGTGRETALADIQDSREATTRGFDLGIADIEAGLEDRLAQIENKMARAGIFSSSFTKDALVEEADATTRRMADLEAQKQAELSTFNRQANQIESAYQTAISQLTEDKAFAIGELNQSLDFALRNVDQQRFVSLAERQAAENQVLADYFDNLFAIDSQVASIEMEALKLEQNRQQFEQNMAQQQQQFEQNMAQQAAQFQQGFGLDMLQEQRARDLLGLQQQQFAADQEASAAAAGRQSTLDQQDLLLSLMQENTRREAEGLQPLDISALSGIPGFESLAGVTGTGATTRLEELQAQRPGVSTNQLIREFAEQRDITINDAIQLLREPPDTTPISDILGFGAAQDDTSTREAIVNAYMEELGGETLPAKGDVALAISSLMNIPIEKVFGIINSPEFMGEVTRRYAENIVAQKPTIGPINLRNAINDAGLPVLSDEELIAIAGPRRQPKASEVLNPLHPEGSWFTQIGKKINPFNLLLGEKQKENLRKYGPNPFSVFFGS